MAGAIWGSVSKDTSTYDHRSLDQILYPLSEKQIIYHSIINHAFIMLTAYQTSQKPFVINAYDDL